MMNKTTIWMILGIFVLLVPTVEATTYNGYVEAWTTPFPYPTTEPSFNQNTFTDSSFHNQQIICNSSSGPPCTMVSGSGALVGNPASSTGSIVGMSIFSDPAGTGSYTMQMSYSFSRTSAGLNSGISVTFRNAFAIVNLQSNGTLSHSSCVGTTLYTASTALSYAGVIIISYDNATNLMAFDDGAGSSCLISNAAPTTSVQIAGASGSTTSSSFGSLYYNIFDGHTFVVNTINTAPEFDQGLKDFASGLGFKTPESKTFFALIVIALTEILMAFFTGFFGDGKWRLWAIHGVAGAIGVICVLLGYIQFWILLVGLVLATTFVNGGRETLNTFKTLAKAGLQLARSRLGARAIDMETGAAVDFEGEDGVTEIEGSATEVDAEAPEAEPESPAPAPEPEPEQSVQVEKDTGE